MKIVYFDYAAIFINLTLLISLFLQKRIRGKSNVAFIFTISEILLTSIIGVIALTLDNLGSGYILSKKIFHFLYLLFHNLTAVIFVYYLMVLTDVVFKIRKYPLRYLLIFSPSILISIALVVNLFVPIIFYIDAEGVYRRTNLIFVLYGIGIYNLILGLYYLFKYKSYFTTKIFFSIFILFPFIIFSMVFEFFFPNMVVEPFFNTIGLLFISYTIQRPEEIIDFTTKFGNSTAYQEDCKKIIKNDKKVQQIFINITNFKILQDIIGFESGAAFEKFIANRISELNRELKLKADMYYLNNGMFRVIVDERKFSKVASFADKINDRLKMLVKIGDMNINPIATVCIVKCPEDINSVESLLVFGNEIDNPKYFTGRILHAKNLYNSDYFDKIQKVDKLIEKAFNEKNFEVYYQPIYSVKEKRFSSAEALLRLKDPSYGFISPDIFIPAAEKSGAIHKIDTFVLNEVCKFISSDDFKNSGLDYIEVNLSVAHCMQDNITEQIFDILTMHNVDVGKINLEVTETAVALSEDKFISNLKKLTKNNIKISLDDFGSGYSNLKRLSQLPLEIVKIDKSLTDEITNEKVALIFTQLNQIIKSLKLYTVVEGVETKEVLDYFINCNCDFIQGFYFSKPMPRKDFINFLASKKNKK